MANEDVTNAFTIVNARDIMPMEIETGIVRDKM